MTNINELVEFYKNGSITKKSFEAELGRVFNVLTNISVSLDSETTLGTTNASYVAMLVPEYVNDIIKNKLVIDDNLLKNKLDTEAITSILVIAENFISIADSTLYSFFNKNKGTDVTFGECVLLYANIYSLFLNNLLQSEKIYEIANEKTIDVEKLNDVKLAIESGNETIQKAIEYINVHKLLPNQALVSAEDLFQQINSVQGISKYIDQDIDKPVENYFWTKLVSNTTGTFNPESRTELDPKKDFIDKQ
jgi:hypothetical protein